MRIFVRKKHRFPDKTDGNGGSLIPESLAGTLLADTEHYAYDANGNMTRDLNSGLTLMAEKYYFLSPYAFCSNNPVNFVDWNGEDIWQINGQGYISWVKENEEHRLYTTDGNVDDIFNIFKFAADNTSVEWVIHKNGDAYTLGTIHDSDRVGNWEDYGLEKPDASVHSHPGINPSLDDEFFSMQRDYDNVVQDVQTNGRQTRMNYVYFPATTRLYHVGPYGV